MLAISKVITGSARLYSDSPKWYHHPGFHDQKEGESVEPPSPVLVDCAIQTHGFEPYSSQTNHFKIDTYYDLAKRSALLGYVRSVSG